MIRCLELRNWLCYRGDHCLELGKGAYGVHARDVRDEERSNWSGKSALAEAVDFVLHGRLNSDRHFDKDGWITRGEPEGGVRLTIVHGKETYRIKRKRKRGKSEKLEVECDEFTRTGEEAQTFIAKHLTGVGEEDFLHAYYFRQRQMAQFILAKPEPRMDIVGAWIQLGPLEEGTRILREEVAELSRGLTKLQAGVQRDEEAFKVFRSEDEQAADLLKAENWHAEVLREEAQARLAAEENGKKLKLLQSAAQFEALNLEGPKLRKAIEEMELPEPSQIQYLQGQQQELIGESKRIERELVQKLDLSRGKFDGKCPVANIDCPAKDVVCGQRDQASRAADALEKERAQCHKKLANVQDALRSAEAKQQAHDRASDQLAEMRKRAMELLPSYEAYVALGGEPVEADTLWSRVTECGRKVHQATQAIADARMAIARRKEAHEALLLARQRLEEGQVKLQARREALAIFGRQGAQRVLAEGALGDIEAGANDVLTEAGVGLSVSLTWAREGKDPAKTCEACGMPFPASKKVTECPQCATARGLHVIPRLDVHLSNHSGAAEDLAGVAFRFSAAYWLRANRGALWQTAIVDEPFAHCDRAHRRMLGGYLAQALGGARGYEQSIVIAHDAQLLASLPGRIEVVRDGDYSNVRVL